MASANTSETGQGKRRRRSSVGTGSVADDGIDRITPVKKRKNITVPRSCSPNKITSTEQKRTPLNANRMPDDDEPGLAESPGRRSPNGQTEEAEITRRRTQEVSDNGDRRGERQLSSGLCRLGEESGRPSRVTDRATERLELPASPSQPPLRNDCSDKCGTSRNDEVDIMSTPKNGKSTSEMRAPESQVMWETYSNREILLQLIGSVSPIESNVREIESNQQKMTIAIKTQS